MTIRKIFLSAALGFAMAAPAAPVLAQAEIVGGIVGGIIGGTIANSTRPRVYTTYGYSAQREQNRQVQTALNFFSFPAGTPDGVLGQNSRSAISQYQVFIGTPPTGQLTDFERNVLLMAHTRAQSGVPEVVRMMASDPLGRRAVLQEQYDLTTGVTPRVAAAPQPTPTETPAAAPATPVASGSLPSFGTSSKDLLSSHCGRISLLTNANGGFTTQDNITDAGLVLNEQFCLARTYAIEAGTQALADIGGVSAEQVAQICSAYSGAMQDIVAGVSLKPREAVMQETNSFVMNSGKDPSELRTTARICLSHGYETDDMPAAISSALLLTALGEAPFGELVGHHLKQGIGTSKRADFAADWYTASLDALESGSDPVFAPTMGDRPALIRAALSGATAPATSGEAGGETTPVALPTFTPVE